MINEFEICNSNSAVECLECTRETCKLWDADPEVEIDCIYDFKKNEY